jgi:hypothetical protein
VNWIRHERRRKTKQLPIETVGEESGLLPAPDISLHPFLELESLPRRIVLIGGGYIAAESLGTRNPAQSNREGFADDYVCLSDRCVRHRIYGLALPAGIQNIEHRAVGGSPLGALRDRIRQDGFKLDEVGEFITNARQMRARDLMHVGTRRTLWPS